MRTVSIITAAAFMATASTIPARADDTALRLGIGIGAAILGEVLKNSDRPRQRQVAPQRSRQQAPARAASKKAPAARQAVAPVVAALPAEVPIPVSRPDPAEAFPVDSSSPIASAPVLEASRTIAVEEVPHGDFPDVVSIEDEHGRVWGTVDGEVAVKIEQAVELGMSRSDAIAALTDLSPPADETTAALPEAEPKAAEPSVETVDARPVAAPAEVPPAPVVTAPAPAPEAVAVVEKPAPAPEPEPEKPQPLSLDIDL